jgi:hypothetical protein
MITAKGLQQLGFIHEIDFVLQDNCDGPLMENGLREQNVFISEWKSASSQPTEAEIETAHAEWQAEWDAQEYARNRQEEYPSINDLIVALWENVVEERASAVVSLEADRQAVKTKYPKP